MTHDMTYDWHGLQEDALRWGLDVVVGTPGRLLDHVGRGTLQLSDAEFLILDEADQMLDMGFKEEMEKVRRGEGEGERQQGRGCTVPLLCPCVVRFVGCEGGGRGDGLGGERGR